MALKYRVQRNVIYTDAEVAVFVQPEDYNPHNQYYFDILVSTGVDASELERAQDPTKLRLETEVLLAEKVKHGLNAYMIYSKEAWEEHEELRVSMEEAKENWHKRDIKETWHNGMLMGFGFGILFWTLASLTIF